ncbi:hypothetical protein M0R45_029957 [Rubus argutus]|uniref:Uncharacterized protein n=1 Tax=Rubus argutus TaxID=59490 RepID=A0AAW1WCQ2_RUBAR
MRKDDLSEELRKGDHPLSVIRESKSMPSARPTEHDPLESVIENIKARGMPTLLPVECCIYKVPSRFRKGNEEFYKPWVVPIGPYHYGGGSFENMKIYKVKYMESFLKRSGQNMTLCLKVVRSWEAKARKYYAERIHLSSDDFALMMLLDTTFVLELMLRHRFPEYRDAGDRIYQKPRMIEDVYHDLILIENQLPFFVLENMYVQVSKAMSSQGIHLSFAKLTHDFFKHFVKIDEFVEAAAVSTARQNQAKHFLDFIRCYYLPPSSQNQQAENKNDGDNRVDEVGLITQSLPMDQISPSVTTLYEAGVQFETTTTNSGISLLDIEFTNGRLLIPQFTADGWTETLFRNLIAFEKCHDTQDQYISQYMFLMSCMIKSSKDMDLLIDHQIVVSGYSSMSHNMLSSSLFNHIGKGIGLMSTQHIITRVFVKS